jgi:hypothetical protein
MVEVTLFPKRTAPPNSKIPAMIITCFIDNAPLPTDVPIAFARSLAPIFHAIYRPAATSNNTRGSKRLIDNILHYIDLVGQGRNKNINVLTIYYIWINKIYRPI